VKHKNGSRYIVVNELKGKKFKVYDPNKGSQYFLSLHEIKNKALSNKTDWDFTQTEDQIFGNSVPKYFERIQNQYRRSYH